MTLVPIIYTSLIIFSAISFFVLVVSYISYKAKSRNNIPSYKREAEFQRIKLAVQPVIQRNPAIIRVQNYGTEKLKFQRDTAKHTDSDSESYNLSVQAMRRRANSTILLKQSSSERHRNKEYNEDAAEKNPRGNSNQNSQRLTIINNTERFKSSVPREAAKKETAQRLAGNSDINVFNFYSDASDMDMVTIYSPQLHS